MLCLEIHAHKRRENWLRVIEIYKSEIRVNPTRVKFLAKPSKNRDLIRFRI